MVIRIPLRPAWRRYLVATLEAEADRIEDTAREVQARADASGDPWSVNGARRWGAAAAEKAANLRARAKRWCVEVDAANVGGV